MAVQLSRKIPIFRRRNKWDTVTWSRPIVGADGVYVGEDFDRKEIVKLRRAELDPVWRVKSGEYWPLLALDGDLLVSAATKSARLDGVSGRQLWEVSEPSVERLDRLLHPWRSHLVLRRRGNFELVDLKSGAVADRFPDPRPDLTISCGAGGDRVLLLGEHQLAGLVLCFDLSARRVLWEASFIDRLRDRFGIDADNPIIGLLPGSLPDRLIIKRGNGTAACSIEDGHLLWGVPLPLDYGAPYMQDGRVHGVFGDRFIALDEDAGAVIYDVRHPELSDGLYAYHGPSFRGQLAYAMQSGHLAVFDLQDGRLTGFHKYREPLGGVAEADGRLLATAGDGNLLVFEETSGS